MDSVFMAYSDRIVKPLLLKHSRRGPVTCKQISKIADIPHATVRSCVTRMLANNQIIRKGKGRKWGYRYYEPANSN